MDELTQLANALMALDDKLAALHEVRVLSGVLSHVYDDAYRRRPHPREDRSCRKPCPSYHRRPRGRERKAVAVPPLRLVPGKLPLGRENDRHFP